MFIVGISESYISGISCEPCVILSDTKVEDAFHVVESIKSDVCQYKIGHELSSINKYVTLSAGISSMVLRDDFSPEHL